MREQQKSLFKNACAFFLLACISTSAHPNGIASNGNKIIKNEKSYFSIELPNDWKTNELIKSSSELQLSSQSPDNHELLLIYVIKNDEDIDLERFAAADTLMFNKLGKLIDSKKIREYLVVVKGIEKSYKTDSRLTKLLFQVKNNLGYIVMWEGPTNESETYSKIADTFNISWPISKIVGSWFTGIWSWVVGIVGLLLVIGILYLIGKTGQLVRRGVETRKALVKFKGESSAYELANNEKWNFYKKKSLSQIFWPVTGWTLLYTILFFSCSLKIFFISLMTLIPLLLGYFGIFFVPSEEIDDYI